MRKLCYRMPPQRLGRNPYLCRKQWYTLADHGRTRVKLHIGVFIYATMQGLTCMRASKGVLHYFQGRPF